MQIVIDIPKSIYDTIENDQFISRYQLAALQSNIRKGILLPKGHGRIADIDKVLEEMKATRTYDIPFALERVKPIIEADKAESEDEE